MSSRAVMESVAEQWEALEELQRAARKVLPNSESELLDNTSRGGAERALTGLDKRQEQGREAATPPPGASEEPTENEHVREALETRAAGS